MTRKKQNKIPESGRWIYKIQVNVEETRNKAEKNGFFCRSLEGQPKNKRGKDGWGEEYPLNQYEITGGDFPSNIKIHLSHKTTQIFFFSNKEITAPESLDLEGFEHFLDNMERFVTDLETTERIMNKLAAFAPTEKLQYGFDTRTNARIPSMYRLIIESSKANQKMQDAVMKAYWDEFNKALHEIGQGRPYLAKKRLDLLVREATSFQLSLIEMAKEWGNPKAEKWESDLKKILKSPFDIFSEK
jgi:hypothetical protein